MCGQCHREKCGDKALRQRCEDQDMARRVGLGLVCDLWQHPHGHGAKPYYHRPVLLPLKELSKPDLQFVHFRYHLQQHQGHLWCAEPAGPLWVQRFGAMHQYHGDWGRAASGHGANHIWPVLLECVWHGPNHDDTASRVLARGFARVCYGYRRQHVLLIINWSTEACIDQLMYVV